MVDKPFQPFCLSYQQEEHYISSSPRVSKGLTENLLTDYVKPLLPVDLFTALAESHSMLPCCIPSGALGAEEVMASSFSGWKGGVKTQKNAA